MGGKPRKPSTQGAKEGDYKTTSANGPGGNAKVAYWHFTGGDWVKITKSAYEAKNAEPSVNSPNAAVASLGAEGGLAPAAVSSSSYRYPKDMSGSSDFVLFQFYDYQPPFRQQTERNYNQTSDYTDTSKAAGYNDIVLYMPEDISTGFRASWTGKSMSTLTADSLRALGQKGFSQKITTGAGAVGKLLERGGALAGAAAIQAATQRLTGDSLSYDDIFGSISGSILNPNTELLFNAIDLRNFSLNFKLVPRNAPEKEDINNIIKQFKQATLPTRSPGAVLGFNASKAKQNTGVELGFIGLPKLCRVSFMHETAEHPVLPRYKMCALISVDVNYTPDGAYATYNNSNGQPVAIGLSLNFQETKICFAEDLAGGAVR